MFGGFFIFCSHLFSFWNISFFIFFFYFGVIYNLTWSAGVLNCKMVSMGNYHQSNLPITRVLLVFASKMIKNKNAEKSCHNDGHHLRHPSRIAFRHCAERGVDGWLVQKRWLIKKMGNMILKTYQIPRPRDIKGYIFVCICLCFQDN